MYTGLADQEALAKTDFLTNPRALVGVVLDGVKGGDARVKLLGEIAARYMETYLDADPPKLSRSYCNPPSSPSLAQPNTVSSILQRPLYSSVPPFAQLAEQRA